MYSAESPTSCGFEQNLIIREKSEMGWDQRNKGWKRFFLEGYHLLSCAWFKCFLEMTLARILLQDCSMSLKTLYIEVFPAAHLHWTVHPACSFLLYSRGSTFEILGKWDSTPLSLCRLWPVWDTPVVISSARLTGFSLTCLVWGCTYVHSVENWFSFSCCHI